MRRPQLLQAKALALVLVMTVVVGALLGAAAPPAAAAYDFSNFCDVPGIFRGAVPCPDSIDFYWRPALVQGLMDGLALVSPAPKSGRDTWVSVVKPMTTYFFYDPAPAGKHYSDDIGFAGWGYDWYVVPASYWSYGDGHSGAGLAWDGEPLTSWHPYARSSYGSPDLNPNGEPGFVGKTRVFWGGWAYLWHLSWTGIQMYKLPLVAWQAREHVVSVRQVLPMGFGG